MEITIQGKTYPLHFGMRFIKELDDKYNVDQGVKFGTGVKTIYSRLNTSDPYALFEALHASLNTKDGFNLTVDQFEKWVDSLESDEEYVDFFDKFVTALSTARMTKPLIEAADKDTETVQKMMEKVVMDNLKKNLPGNNTEK